MNFVDTTLNYEWSKSGPDGISLSEEILTLMDEEERNFWKEFLAQAKIESERCYRNHEDPPFAPTPFLVAMHQRAKNVFNGQKYSVMTYLEEIFNFGF